jgi:hypothetical protein
VYVAGDGTLNWNNTDPWARLNIGDAGRILSLLDLQFPCETPDYAIESARVSLSRILTVGARCGITPSHSQTKLSRYAKILLS